MDRKGSHTTNNCPRALREITNIMCEGQIAEEELLDAIKAFKAGETPGLDGIPVEVYQTCFDYQTLNKKV